MKTVQINIRANKDIKQKAEKIFNSLGLTNSQAVNLFYNQVVLNEAIPFELKLPKNKKPNKETIQAFHDVDNNIGVTNHDSAEAMFESFGVNVDDL
jgi:DNA-damage-inducible protein J